jgi:hypothetical protein
VCEVGHRKGAKPQKDFWGGLLRLSWAEASYMVPSGPPAPDPVVIGRTTYQIITVPLRLNGTERHAAALRLSRLRY